MRSHAARKLNVDAGGVAGASMNINIKGSILSSQNRMSPGFWKGRSGKNVRMGDEQKSQTKAASKALVE